MPDSPPLLVIAGPTAAGKTAAAIHVAHLWGARLVSADAMQVYRGMDIGTGKVPPFVLGRFPHLAVDIRDPDEPWCAQDFAELADRAIAEGERVIVVGGTVLYLRALLYGLIPAPAADLRLRAELEALPDPHAELGRVDPILAARLHPNDRVRIIRGLEVHRLTGTPLSTIQSLDPHRARHDAVVLWLDRPDLRPRIDQRVDRMMERGYLREVQALLEKGYSRELKPLKSLGYVHLCAHLLDGIPLEEAVRLTKRDTWTFARKQRTWARQHPDWTSVPATDRAAILEAARRLWGDPRRIGRRA